MLRLVFVVLAGLVVLGNAAPASAQEISCTVSGAVQGQFFGDPGSPGGAKTIPVLYLTQEITTPFDTATGTPTGMREHKPVTIIKELDASSLQFFHATLTSETLTSVICSFYRFRSVTGLGATHPYFKITLTDAHIVDYRDAGDGINGTAPGDEHERISLTYRTITLTDANGRSVEDMWSGLAK